MLNSKLAQRLFFGTVMSVALGALLLGEAWLQSKQYFTSLQLPAVGFAALVTFFVAAGARELCLLARSKNLQPSIPIIVLCSVAVATVSIWSQFLPITAADILPFLLIATLMLTAFAQGVKCRNENALANISLACFAVFYLGLGGWFILQIRLLNENMANPNIWQLVGPLLMFVATVKSADIGAYLIGRKIGRHKWVPSISPAKTWEGFIGGVALSIIVASIFACQLAIMPWWAAVVFGVLIAVTGQLGDLLESMLKRDLGSKDSAQLVPQFGGFLDLLDSVLIAAPFAYVMFRAVININ